MNDLKIEEKHFHNISIENKKIKPANTYDYDVIAAVNTLANHACPPPVHYKYAEDQIVGDFLKDLEGTYNQHYKSETQKIECFDAWIAMGDATPTFRNTAMKYLWRYGKKGGSQKNDLFKAMHYVLMCLYNDYYRKK